MGESSGDILPINPIPEFGKITEDQARQARSAIEAFLQRDPAIIANINDLAIALKPVQKAAMTVLLRYGSLHEEKTPFINTQPTGGITPDTIDDVADDMKPMMDRETNPRFGNFLFVGLKGNAGGEEIQISTSGASVLITSNWGQENPNYFYHLPAHEAIITRQPKEPVVTAWGWELVEGTRQKYEPSHSDPLDANVNQSFMRLSQRALDDMLKIIPQ